MGRLSTHFRLTQRCASLDWRWGDVPMSSWASWRFELNFTTLGGLRNQRLTPFRSVQSQRSGNTVIGRLEIVIGRHVTVIGHLQFFHLNGIKRGCYGIFSGFSEQYVISSRVFLHSHPHRLFQPYHHGKNEVPFFKGKGKTLRESVTLRDHSWKIRTTLKVSHKFWGSPSKLARLLLRPPRYFRAL